MVLTTKAIFVAHAGAAKMKRDIHLSLSASTALSKRVDFRRESERDRFFALEMDHLLKQTLLPGRQDADRGPAVRHSDATR